MHASLDITGVYLRFIYSPNCILGLWSPEHILTVAGWTLKCKLCKRMFTHSLIPDTLQEFFHPTRPIFPPAGTKHQCPHCQNKSQYFDVDLGYDSLLRASLGQGC